MAEYDALDALKRQAVKLLDEVIDDASLANAHAEARKLTLELITAKSGGVTDNDFILASKIDQLG